MGVWIKKMGILKISIYFSKLPSYIDTYLNRLKEMAKDIDIKGDITIEKI
mgnify:CR=1 FL=1|jgi:hypothetical protein